MFELRREVLFAELLSQMESGSVLVTGAPGIGKSWLIGRLLGHLKQNRRFVLPLIAEEYEVSTLEELQKALGLKVRVESLLAKRDGAVLLIDGLDALRAEGSQRVFRDLIIGILKNAPNATVVASIRSFDLAESPVFSSLSSFIPGLGKPFSSLVVGALGDEEIEPVRRDRSNFDELWQIANSDTRQLLRTPFNLVIALALMKEGFSSTDLSGIGSQVALLDEFWGRRIERVPNSLERKRLLGVILDRMVQLKTLSVAEVDISNVELANALRETLSVELLRKNVTGRIFFSHNILFDYALARVILDEVRLPTFLAEDSNRSLYYRPSLNFFFGHVWLADRLLFWKIVQESMAAGALPESVSVIPAVVVCQMANRALDFEPLHANPDSSVLALLRRVLVGLQALGVPPNRRGLWIDFVSRLSQLPNVVFINELLSVLGILKEGMRSNEHARLNLCARNTIEWSWTFNKDRPAAQQSELASFVSGRVLPIVLQTLHSAPESSKNLVQQILNRIGTPGASSGELFWLANDMHLIVDFDPTLAATVYEAIYGYKELSEERVSISSGSVMNLVISESQQYEGLFYQLNSRFHTLLERDFFIAARTAVRLANIEILRERPLNEREPLAVVRMRVAHHLISYALDYSEIWDSGGGRDYTSLQMFDSVLRLVKDRANTDHLNQLVDVIFAEGGVAILFKKLFEEASRSIERYADALKPSLLSARFISAPEVTIAIGEFLTQLKTVAGNDRVFWGSVEQTILQIPRSKPVLRYERPRSIQIRLLACFRELLRDPRSLKILESADEPRPNRPFYQISGGAIAADSPQVYRLRGINPDDPTNSGLIKAIEAAKVFAYRSPNSPPSLADVEATFPMLVNLAEVIVQSEAASSDLLVNARGTLYAAVSTMSLVKEIKLDSPLFEFELSAAIAGASDVEPVFDPKYHMPFDTPGWGSPSPRIEAAQAIVNLVWNYKEDRRALPVFRRLMHDPVPAVRFQIARGLVALYAQDDLREEFWESLRAMFRTESTNGVTLGLLQSLGQVAGREPAKTMSVLADYIVESYRESERPDVMRGLVGIVAGLYLAQGTPEARVQLQHFEQDIEKYHRELSQMVLAAGQQITPVDGTEIQRERAREIWNAVLDAVLRRSDELNRQTTPRDFHAVVGVLDTLISRLFFSFDLIGTRAPGQNALDHEGRRTLFSELREFIEKIVQADEIESVRDVPLIPRTAHYFLQLMNGVLEFAPDDVLRYAYAICKRGARTGYLEDSMARTEAVKLVEKALADFRDRLKKPRVATAVAGMLNLFTEHAWPEAVTLTFRLEEAFR
jgi:hypothetical protein